MAIQSRDWESDAAGENAAELKARASAPLDTRPDAGQFTAVGVETVAHAGGQGAQIQHEQSQEHVARVSPNVGSQSRTTPGANIARQSGQPKGDGRPTMVHAGTASPAQLAGNSHAVRYGEIPHPDAGNPLDDEPLQKEYVGKGVPIKAGQRSRTINNEVGPAEVGQAHASAVHVDDSDAILSEATLSGSTVVKR